MTTVILFSMAVFLMVIGHIFRVKRWELFISIYEKPSETNLLHALSIGHIINAVLPVRLGDFIRVFWSGRRLKTGYSGALASVAVELYMDVATVGAMFFGLSLLGKGGDRLRYVAHIYIFLYLTILLATLISVLFRKQVKKIVRVAASVFNTHIEFLILYVVYLFIAFIKDIFQSMNKRKLVLFTCIMWMGYMISYIVFAEVAGRYGYGYTTYDILTELFSLTGVRHIEAGIFPLWMIYLLLPSVVCWAVSMILTGDNDEPVQYRNTLPQMNASDRLAFLKTYYADENREHIKSYLAINQDVTIVEDNTAGSNASTILAMKSDGALFFRKYAFDEDGDKLQAQIDWIENHQQDIPLPVIADKRREGNYVMYDMHSYMDAVGLFRYIHTMPLSKSWEIIIHALDDIEQGLYMKAQRKADISNIQTYINQKIYKNLRFIRNKSGKYIRGLEQYEYIYVNGEKRYTLHRYLDMFDQENLIDVFSQDMYTEIHGDLTIENIICLSDNHEIDRQEYKNKVLPQKYYFIDPNRGNIHDSPFLDYGKLLQSLHGGYEFLMKLTDVTIRRDQVNFMIILSENYKEIYEKYKQYLCDHFTGPQIRSIYYHEIVHWLRLIPYKVRKNEKLAVIFYAELLKILADVREMDHEK